MLSPFVRFDPLIRKALRFRRRVDSAKARIGRDIAWYPYDSFANLFQLVELLWTANRTLDSLAGPGPILDVGAADGALSLFLESLGHEVHALDYSGTNMNRMRGLHALSAAFHSSVRVVDRDIDRSLELDAQYSLTFFLGTLYHVKNPFHVLELLARHSRDCFLSTRVARTSPDGRISFGDYPMAYLLSSGEVNQDVTNYWIFSPMAVERLVQRCGWRLLASKCAGAANSDPLDRDERMFLLLETAKNA